MPASSRGATTGRTPVARSPPRRSSHAGRHSPGRAILRGGNSFSTRLRGRSSGSLCRPVRRQYRLGFATSGHSGSSAVASMTPSVASSANRRSWSGSTRSRRGPYWRRRSCSTWCSSCSIRPCDSRIVSACWRMISWQSARSSGKGAAGSLLPRLYGRQRLRKRPYRGFSMVSREQRRCRRTLPRSTPSRIINRSAALTSTCVAPGVTASVGNRKQPFSSRLYHRQ